MAANHCIQLNEGRLRESRTFSASNEILINIYVLCVESLRQLMQVVRRSYGQKPELLKNNKEKMMFKKFTKFCFIYSFVLLIFTLISCSDDKSPSKPKITDVSGWYIVEDVEEYLQIVQNNSNLKIFDGIGNSFGEGEINDNTVTATFAYSPNDTLTFLYNEGKLIGTEPFYGIAIILTKTQSGPNLLSLVNHTITVDGQTTDWINGTLIIDDDNNDAGGNQATEIDKFYMCEDNAYIYFRIDLVGDAVFPHSGHNNDRYDIRLITEGLNVYSIGIWDTDDVRFRANENRESNLDNAGVSGKILECRVLKANLGNPEKAVIAVESFYFFNDTNKGYYDKVLVYIIF